MMPDKLKLARHADLGFLCGWNDTAFPINPKFDNGRRRSTVFKGCEYDSDNRLSFEQAFIPFGTNGFDVLNDIGQPR